MQRNADKGQASPSPSPSGQESKEMSGASVAAPARSKKRHSKSSKPGSSKKAGRQLLRSLRDAAHLRAGANVTRPPTTAAQELHQERGTEPGVKESETVSKPSSLGSVLQPTPKCVKATEPGSPHSTSSKTAMQSPASCSAVSPPDDAQRKESAAPGAESTCLQQTGQRARAEGEHTPQATAAHPEAPATTTSGAQSTTHESTASRTPHSFEDLAHASEFPPTGLTPSSPSETSHKGLSHSTSALPDDSARQAAAKATEAPVCAKSSRTPKNPKRLLHENGDNCLANRKPVDRAADGMLTLNNASCPSPTSGYTGRLSTATDQQPETGLREMANLPSLLERLVEPFRRRAHFGSVTLKVLSPWSTMSPSPSPLKMRTSTITPASRWPLVAAAAVFFLALAMIAYALLRATNGSDKSGTGPRLCQTSDCHWHAGLFAQRLNESIDPCDDFGAFACSAWTASSSAHVKTSAREEVVLGFAEAFEGMLTTVQMQMPVGKRALELYRACMDSMAYNDQSREVIRTFMADQGVPWPRQGSSPTSLQSPLKILIRFAIRWRLPLWFRVRMLTTARGRPTVLLADNPKMQSWAAIHRRLVRENSGFEYWTRHYEVLSPQRGYTGAETAEGRSESDKVFQIQDSVFHELLEEREGKNETGAMFPLANIEEYATSALLLRDWLEELSDHATAAGELNFSGASRVILKDVGLLAALGRLWAKHSRAELIEALSWLLAQVIGPIADIRLLRLRYDSSAGANSLPRDFCVAQVEDVYRLLVIALSTVSKFPEHRRRDINSRFAQLQKTAVTLVGSLKWLDSTTRARAQNKLSGTSTVLWPAQDLLADSTLSVLYASFPTSYTKAAETFADLWIRSRRALYDLETDPVYHDAADMPANMALPLVDYDYVRLAVRVSMQALSWPVYYAHGTDAMFFGGLGFLYATELIKSIDAEGTTFDIGGNVGNAWTSDVWRDAIAERTSCMARHGTDDSDEGRGGGLFPYTPALEVVYAALQEAVAADTPTVHVLEGYTEQQLFFITLCYLMCGAAHPGSRDCNKALRHFPPFARHFRCDRGSKMRADEQCSFLYLGYSEQQDRE
ncbi:endothelin-converting enzyme 1-like [Amblyomma americanum]